MPDKPVRHRRRGLLIPFLIVGALLAAWTGWWFYLTRQIETRLQAQVAAMEADGWAIQHGRVSTTGWPFRARVEIPHLSLLSPSGHGVASSEVIAEANAYNPDRWVVIAPDDLTLTRAGKGKVGITGDGARLSVSHLRDRFPDFRLELIRPTFTPHPGAEEFPIASAERVQLYTRPHLTDGRAATDAMDVLFVLTDARGRPGGPVEGASQQGMLSLQLETTIQQASRLTGADSAGIFANWTEAGGRFVNIRGEASAGESRALITSDVLAANGDGRLQGDISIEAEKPLAAISGLARSGGGSVNRVGAAGAAAATAVRGDQPLDLVVRFDNGRTWLGPFALAPAPKLF